LSLSLEEKPEGFVLNPHDGLLLSCLWFKAGFLTPDAGLPILPCMSSCSHKTLVLIRETGGKVRCRTCHLVISADELNGRFCPECYDVNHEKRYDFEPVESEGDDVTRYRCEGCGAMIEWKEEPSD
jgi:hypothetical protein